MFFCLVKPISFLCCLKLISFLCYLKLILFLCYLLLCYLGIHHFYGRPKKLIIYGHYFHNELFLRYPWQLFTFNSDSFKDIWILKMNSFCFNNFQNGDSCSELAMISTDMITKMPTNPPPKCCLTSVIPTSGSCCSEL